MKRKEIAKLLSVTPQSIVNYTEEGMPKEIDSPPRWVYAKCLEWLKYRGKRDFSTTKLADTKGVTNKIVKEWVKLGCPSEKTKEGTHKFNLVEVNAWGVDYYGKLFNKVMEER